MPTERSSTSVPPTTVLVEPAANPIDGISGAAAASDTIDEASLNRILEALERVNGDALRLMVTAKAITPEAVERLRAIYAEDEFQAQLRLYQEDVIEKFDGVHPVPDNRRTTVTRILEAGPGCIYTEVVRDYRGVALEPNPPGTEYIALVPKEAVRDPGNHNPTPWSVALAAFNPDRSAPPSPCSSA